jgi:hypothetical protein
MTITKCDICHKELPWDGYITASPRGTFHRFSFCDNCGKPILLFLEKHGLIEKQKEALKKNLVRK